MALVLAVASVIVGTQLLRGLRFLKATTAVVLGSILYKACVALALSLGLVPQDLKLVTAVLFLAIFIWRTMIVHRDDVLQNQPRLGV